MNNISEKKIVSRLIYEVLTEKKNVREAILLFPKSKDKNIECAYHALVHYEADEELRKKDIEYREEQDEYLEFIAETLGLGKSLPRNIIADYEPFYKGMAHKWEYGLRGMLKELCRFINS